MLPDQQLGQGDSGGARRRTGRSPPGRGRSRPGALHDLAQRAGRRPTRGRRDRRAPPRGRCACESSWSRWCRPDEQAARGVTRPESGSSSPVITCSSVVFPSPLRPTMPTRSPAVDAEGDVVEEGPDAVRLGDVNRLRPQHLPQCADLHLQIVLFDHETGPDEVEQLVLRDQPIAPLDERQQHVERPRAEWGRRTVGSQLAGGRTQLEAAKAVDGSHGGCSKGWPNRAAEWRMYANAGVQDDIGTNIDRLRCARPWRPVHDSGRRPPRQDPGASTRAGSDESCRMTREPPQERESTSRRTAVATNEKWMQRRRVVQAFGAVGALGAVGGAKLAWAQAGKIKVGFMLPYTGTFAALGAAIENGFRLYVAEQGGKLGGREIEYFKVDDESEPSKARRQRQQADQARQGRRRRRHRALRRADGDGQGRAGDQHAADHSERRRRRRPPGRCARRTSSAPRSPTGSRATRWAWSLREEATRPR